MADSVLIRQQRLSNQGFSQKQIPVIDDLMQGVGTVVSAATPSVIGGVLQSVTVAAPAALTSSQNTTPNGSDATTTQTLANALKVSYNAAQTDLAALRVTVADIITNLRTAGIMS